MMNRKTLGCLGAGLALAGAGAGVASAGLAGSPAPVAAPVAGADPVRTIHPVLENRSPDDVTTIRSGRSRA